MLALHGESDAVMPKGLPGVRLPPGKTAGKLAPDCSINMEADPRLLPRLPQGGSGGSTARGPTPPPSMPAPAAPLGPLLRPGKTIESVLRALPASGGSAGAPLCGPKGSLTWPADASPRGPTEASPRRDRRRREAARDFLARSEAVVGAEECEKATFSPRPPADGKPMGARKLGPGRRASSEGPQQPLSPAASNESARVKRTPRERPESIDGKSRGSAPTAAACRASSDRPVEVKRRGLAMGESGGHRRSGAPPEPQTSPRRPTPRSAPRTPSPSIVVEGPSCSDSAGENGALVGRAEPRPVRTARGEAAEWFQMFLQEAEEEANNAVEVRAATANSTSAKGSESCSAKSTQAVPGPLPQKDDSRPSSASSAVAAVEEETGFVGTRPTLAESRSASSTMIALSSMAAAATAKAASNGSNLLIFEEMDNEREMWEARTRQLLKGQCSSTQAKIANASTGISALADGNDCNGDASDIAAISRKEPPDCTEAPSETSEAVTSVGETRQGASEDSLIIAALKAAGLQPGVEAREALILGGHEKLAAPSLQTVSELTDDADAQGVDDESAVNGLAVGLTEEGTARWAMSARQWAQQRLRRKRERASGSRPGTPCSGKASGA